MNEYYPTEDFNVRTSNTSIADTYLALARFALQDGDPVARQEYLAMAEMFQQQ